jgi:PQQ-dependent catabolism-associated CXXCW motif protein
MTRVISPLVGEMSDRTEGGRDGTRYRTIVLLLAALATTPTLAQSIPEPSGYRMDEYRAPVPKTLKGAQVVTTVEAEKIWRAKSAVFVDVMPQAPKPDNLPKGTIWRDKPRDDIPGSVWLANVGYGLINAETEAYFRAGMAQNGAADKKQPVVFYCMTNCWMSWNAAKRAVEWGLRDGFVVSRRGGWLVQGRAAFGNEDALSIAELEAFCCHSGRILRQ